jgi:p-hydroxybenzoate 3-monooxygenase
MDIAAGLLFVVLWASVAAKIGFRDAPPLTSTSVQDLPPPGRAIPHGTRDGARSRTEGRVVLGMRVRPVALGPPGSPRQYAAAVRRVTVGIVGAGPAGLVLANLLLDRGVDCVVVERQSRVYCEQRVRAGLLEEPTVSLLRTHGWADRLLAEGLEHRGTELRYLGRRFRLDYEALVGRTMWVYPQQELVADLIRILVERGGEAHFEVDDVAVHDLTTDRPRLTFGDEEVVCSVLAGCDGFFGICRPSIPDGALNVYDRHHEFGWVAVLAAVAPSTDEIIYSLGPRGFAGHMLRTPTVSRFYLQCPPGDDIEHWSDDRIWSDLHLGLATHDGWTLAEGPVLEKSIVEMRSHVVAPMRYGRMFLAGDAAHIVPPVGAKGMNLAIADAAVLADAVTRYTATGNESGFDAYSATCLERVWRVQDFSMWMAWMLHSLPDGHPDRAYTLQRSYAQLRYLETSASYQGQFAENYVGFPLPVTA